MPTSPLVSLGYQGRSIDELIGQLVDESVTILVDVRLTPLSRKPGRSKRRLAEALESAGIRYVHLRALGNPKENRQPFRAGDPRSHELYEGLLADGAGAEALRHVAELLGGDTVALLCFERDHRQCHRHLVAGALRRTTPALELIEI
jgi:uncharacterized protein (DUF488 family)